MRLALISPAVAAVLAAAVAWAPLPHRLIGGDVDAAGSNPPRAAGASAVEPGAITPSHAATFVRFGPETTDGASPAAAPPPKPAPPALVGLIGSSPRRIAYVLLAGQTVRAGLWDKVGPWRLTAIGPRGVTLSAGRKSLSLALYGPRPLPPPPIVAANPNASTDSAPSLGAPSLAAPPMRALEPASAPVARSAGRPRYWTGGAGSAPPGYIVLRPDQVPPP